MQLCNYKGPARIVVSLVTSDENPMPHAHSLIGKNASNGVVTVQIGPEQGMTARCMISIIITIVFANVRDILFIASAGPEIFLLSYDKLGLYAQEYVLSYPFFLLIA